MAGVLLPGVVYAEKFSGSFDVPQPVGAIPPNVLGEVIGNAITLVIIVAGLLTTAYLIWGGIEWLTSGGEKASYQAARDRITHAFIGLAIVLSSYLVIKILEYLFHVSILGTVNIPTLWK